MALDHQPLKHLLGYALARATILTDKVFDQAIRQRFRLRRVEFTILLLMSANLEVTAKKLATALSLSAPSMSVIVDRLEDRGLVKRVASTTDNRSWVLQLTAKGHALASEAARVSAHMEDNMLSRLSTAERAMLLELLEKVAAGPKVK